jgi:DNA-binding NarL/FixJ family response regulator
MKMKATRIFVVDDHPLVRDGLALLIGSERDLQVCGSAGSMREALAQIAQAPPDVMVVDLSLKDGLGLELIKTVKERHPQVRILVVSAYEEGKYAERALRSGALGYVNKQECETKLLEAIRTVLAGRRHVSEEILQRLVNQALGGTDGEDPVTQLSDREFEVYRLIGRGVTTVEIAKQLHVSPHTIDSHREKIRHKLELKNGHELLQHAIRWIIDNEP